MATKSETKPVVNKPRLQQLFNNSIKNELKKDLNLDNINQVPKLSKIVVSVGYGRGKDDKRLIATATNTLAKITGQKPIATIARKSIASFKLREGQEIGQKVTLRGDIMYEFADRLINIVLPRLRDFHGVSPKSLDPQGNYSIGLPDQSVFPELSYEETAVTHGLQVTFVTTADSTEKAKALLSKLGMPFMKEGGR